MKKVKKLDPKTAIEAVERAETESGVEVKSGLRAGGGVGGGKDGPPMVPLYGTPAT